MIIGGSHSCLDQLLRILFRMKTTAHIDNGTAGFVLQKMDKLLKLVGDIIDHVGKILSFETHAEDALLAEQQTLLNVVDDGRGSGGRQRQNGYARQLLADIGNGEIAGAEVVAPLTDTMSLIDADEAHLHVTQLLLEKI